jgi:hypothetical protein
MRSILESLAGTGGSWRLIAAILGIALITIYLDREARR